MGLGWLYGCGALLLAILPASADEESGEIGPPVQVRIALPSEPGQYRTRSQPVYDARAQALARRTYTVWDTRPSRGLDFAWLPGPGAKQDAAGRVTGEGRLVWRLAGKPAYDPAALQAEYRGRLRAGKLDGTGTFEERGGLTYEGAWIDGLPNGAGTLRLGNGAEFTGRFVAGIAEGAGRFYDVDGEVFEGAFQDGFREGVGRTVLPGGGAYRSEWVRGEEVANSRRLRVVQLGPAAGEADDLRLGISVDRVDDASLLQYSARNREGGLVIQPSPKRLMGLWKGDEPIQLTASEEGMGARNSYGVFSYAKADLVPLTLVFEVQNRSAAPIRVRGAYLDVASSVSDLQPAIQLAAGGSNECGVRNRANYSPRFELENFGWGPAERARLRFGFARPNASVATSGMNVVKDIGTIAATSKVDLEPELRAAGVKTDQLKRQVESGIACKSKGNPAACLSEIAATGMFGSLARTLTLEDRDIFVQATGELDYVWRDAKGSENSRTSPFSAKLMLGRTPLEAECGEGAEKEPISRRPLEFRLDQENYRLPVAFERTIPASRTARYTVTVKAAKSSGHDFKVVIQTADGRQVVSRPVALTYFLPSRIADGSLSE